jgi:hypothetical protein
MAWGAGTTVVAYRRQIHSNLSNEAGSSRERTKLGWITSDVTVWRPNTARTRCGAGSRTATEPLIPFVIPDLSIDTRFFASAVAIAFFGIGAAKGAVLHRSALRSGLETLLTGGGAALLAYVVGAWLRAAFGAS